MRRSLCRSRGFVDTMVAIRCRHLIIARGLQQAWVRGNQSTSRGLWSRRLPVLTAKRPQQPNLGLCFKGRATDRVQTNRNNNRTDSEAQNRDPTKPCEKNTTGSVLVWDVRSHLCSLKGAEVTLHGRNLFNVRAQNHALERRQQTRWQCLRRLFLNIAINSSPL